LQQFARHNQQTWFFDSDGKALPLPPTKIAEEETLLAQAAGPFTINELIPGIQNHLSHWIFYQNVRVDQNASIRQDAISRFENRVSDDGQNLINVLHTLYTSDRDFKQQINDAMYAAFGEDFDELIFPPTSDQRVQLRVRWKTLQREQSAADLSDGTLRFLFLLAVLASPNPAPLIAIDEPETGLHPSMLPIIAEFAVDAARRTQVIFTTHSDQFLDAFRDTKPTTTVASWEDGQTTLTTLNGDELDYWLKGYSLGSLFRSGELEALA
jgi:predicted ATPase